MKKVKFRKPKDPKWLKLPKVYNPDIMAAGKVAEEFVNFLNERIGKFEKRKKLTDKARAEMQSLANERARLNRFVVYANTIGKNEQMMNEYNVRNALWRRQQGLPLSVAQEDICAVYDRKCAELQAKKERTK